MDHTFVFIAGALLEKYAASRVLILISFPPYDASPWGQASPQKALSIHSISSQQAWEPERTIYLRDTPTSTLGPLRHSYALKRNVEPTTTTLYRWEKNQCISLSTVRSNRLSANHSPHPQRATTQSKSKNSNLGILSIFFSWL